MPIDAYKNGSFSAFAVGFDNVANSANLVAGTGSKFPIAPFNCTVWNSTDYLNPLDDPFYEIIRITDVSGDTMTFIRGQEGTSAYNHNLAGKVYGVAATITAKVFNVDIPSAINNVKALNWFLS